MRYFIFFFVAFLFTTAFSQKLSDILAPENTVLKRADGFKFTEGPAYHPAGFLLFSDIPNQRIMKFDPVTNQTTEFLSPSGRSNGLMFDQKGDLYLCQGGLQRLAKMDLTQNKKIKTLADSFDGKPLNSPNDLALDAHGGVYFTDPRYGRAPAKPPQSVMGVYYLQSNGKIIRVIDSLERPNGVLVSPDGKYLYVAEPNHHQLYRFTITTPGTLTEKTLLFTGDPTLDKRGPDGMAHDIKGNIYATYKSLVILNPTGKLIGRVAIPEKPSNCTFGGPNLKTLYITARTSLYSIQTKIQGMPLQAPVSVKAEKTIVEEIQVKAGALPLTIPKTWKQITPRSNFRKAQFEIPAATNETEPGQYIVYFFPGGAGSIEANIQRWIGQFEEKDRQVQTLNGESASGKYTLVDITGTYLQPIGPPMARKSKRMPAARMLAAIIETKEGNYFLKFTGGKKTVTAAEKRFKQSFGATEK